LAWLFRVWAAIPNALNRMFLRAADRAMHPRVAAGSLAMAKMGIDPVARAVWDEMHRHMDMGGEHNTLINPMIAVSSGTERKYRKLSRLAEIEYKLDDVPF